MDLVGATLQFPFGEPMPPSMRRARGAKRTGGVRLIFEWLGLAAPERGRKEPVALPTWAPVAVATVGALLTGLLGALLTLAARVLS